MRLLLGITLLALGIGQAAAQEPSPPPDGGVLRPLEADAATPEEAPPSDRELGSHISLWLGLGSTSLTQDARAADAFGTSVDVTLGVDLRLADPGELPLAGLLSYEVNLGIWGYEEREVLDRRGKGELWQQGHLLEAGLGPAFLVVPGLLALYPYASYTLTWQVFDRDDFRPNRRSPIPLRGFESHERILAHGPGGGLELAFRFGDYGGLDFGLSYAYLLDVEVDVRSDLVSDLDPFESDGHAIRMSTRLWFTVWDTVSLGVRLGSGWRYLRKEHERVGATRVTYPSTYVSPSSVAFYVRWLF